jgi:hypothetical protein
MSSGSNDNSADNNKNDDNKKNNNIPPEKFITINGHKIKYLDYNRRTRRFSNICPILVLLR